MKKGLIILAVFLFTESTIFTQTSGILKITVTTKATGLAGKNYAPRNCMAIWIEDQSGKFVKTLLTNAQQRRSDLNYWEASTSAAGSKFNVTDALSGATNNSHGTRTCTWDSRDVNGKLMPDGTFKVFMELTDIDDTGNCYSIAFKKGTKKINQLLPDKQSFTAVRLEWEPEVKGK
jgi:hypothetical protein